MYIQLLLRYINYLGIKINSYTISYLFTKQKYFSFKTQRFSVTCYILIIHSIKLLGTLSLDTKKLKL